MTSIDIVGSSGRGGVIYDEKHHHLADARWRILLEIKQLYARFSDLNIEEHQALRTKKLAYNGIVDSLQDYNHHLGVDPMDKLPNEIWSSIIKYYMNVKRVWDTLPSIESLLLLTLVSKRWCAYILSEATFWNKVVLTDHHNDTPMSAFVSLFFSRDLPLTLYIDLPFTAWSEVRSQIIENRHRIDSIVMSGMYSFESLEEKTRHVSQILQDLHPLPSLRRIGDAYETSNTEYDVTWILQNFTTVSYLPNLALNRQALGLATGLREIYTYERIDAIFPILETLKDLKRVVFWNDHDVDDVDGHSPSRESPPSPNPLHWRSFAYHCSEPKLSISILRRLLSLTSLEFVGDFRLLSDTIGILHGFQNLKRFATHLSLDRKEEQNLPILILPCPTLRSLVITVHHRDQPAPDQINNERALLRTYRTLQGMLSNSMPNIEYLYLSSNEAKCATSFINSAAFPMLKDIHFYGSGATVTPVLTAAHVPSSAKSLLLVCTADIFHALASKTVDSLVWRNHPRGDLMETMDPLAWPTIKKLETHSTSVRWDGIGFESLRVLELSVSMDRTIDNSITSFFRDLAYHPSSYPSLETIVLPECPEWDIFAIMLERRNLLTDPSVKPISNVDFPFPLPRHIDSFVRNLLAGKWTTRPSNFSLSLAGNLEIILDLSMCVSNALLTPY
jgi:hypothetical protein